MWSAHNLTFLYSKCNFEELLPTSLYSSKADLQYNLKESLMQEELEQYKKETVEPWQSSLVPNSIKRLQHVE